MAWPMNGIFERANGGSLGSSFSVPEIRMIMPSIKMTVPAIIAGSEAFESASGMDSKGTIAAGNAKSSE